MRRKYNITAGFLDLLFNCLISFFIILLFVLVLVNPENTNNKDIELKAEFMITMEWESDDPNDIDLFVQLPNRKVVFYGGREASGASLDRDDQGTRNDIIVMEDGSKLIIKENWEHVIIRKIVPGEYTVNILMYTQSLNYPVSRVMVKVERLNPHRLVYKNTLTLDNIRQEKTVVRFRMDDSGKVTNINKIFKSLINSHGGVQ